MPILPPQVRARAWCASLVGLGLGLSALAPARVAAADNVVFVTGAFRRSIPVTDLEHLALTGQPRGLLADVLALSHQNPRDVAATLNQSVALPLTLVSRLLDTRIGTAILERLARIVYPLKASQVGVPALRGALISGLAQGNGQLSPIGFLRAYPSREMEVNIPNLMGIMRKAGSISDLVRFFSESPLDGLRGNDAGGDGKGGDGDHRGGSDVKDGGSNPAGAGKQSS